MVNPLELFELRDIKDYDTAVKYTGKQSDITFTSKTKNGKTCALFA